MGTTGSQSGLRRMGWAGPILAAFSVVAICWWVYHAVRASLEQRLAADLEALVAAQAAAAPRAAADPADPASALAVLARAGAPGDTGETLVFDSEARLLAPSRFDARLRESGVFAGTLGLDLRDPGFDLGSGGRPELERRSLPLTKMAGSATSGKPGVDAQGYRNYRGVPVAGAWRWLPEAKLGVAVEMEVAEAYRPVRTLLLAFSLLGGLAVLAGAAGAWVARRNAALLHKLREAESKARTLGQYTLVKRIGEGGMGEVHLARHAMLRRPTAIKLLRPEKTSPQAIARFEREVQQTSRLTHPNTVQIYDFGRTPGGTFYYAMEYLVGVTLDRFVANHGPLDEGRTIYVL